MRVHHLNCGTMCPFCRRLVEGSGGWIEAAELVCHCLLIESKAGLVLVDTGIGKADIERRGGLGAFFNGFARPRYSVAETAYEQVRSLGYSVSDVRHIIVTHLDLDHAGGVADFADATLHVHSTELGAALHPSTMKEKGRYHPQHVATLRALSDNRPERVKTYLPHGEAWNGLAAAQAIEGLDDDLLLVNLHGHSRGHSAVAVRGESGWLLHCGDAYIHRATVRTGPAGVPAGLRAFQHLAALEHDAFYDRQHELRALHDRGDVTVFCAHDPVEYRELASRGKS